MSGLKASNLENVTLGLLSMGRLQLVDIDVPPEEHKNSTDGDESHTSDNHLALHILVRTNNGISDGIALQVGQLHRNVSVDCRREVLGILRETFVQLYWEDIGPQCSRNSIANGSTNGAEEGKQGQRYSDILVANTSHNGKLTSQSPNTTVDTVEKLTHNKVACLGFRSSEMNQKSSTEDSKWNDCQ